MRASDLTSEGGHRAIFSGHGNAVLAPPSPSGPRSAGVPRGRSTRRERRAHAASGPRRGGAGPRGCARAQGHIGGSGAKTPGMQIQSMEAAAALGSTGVGEKEKQEVMATDLGRGRRSVWLGSPFQGTHRL